MRILRPIPTLALAVFSTLVPAQEAVAGRQAAASDGSAPATATAAAVSASSLLQPALARAQTTLTGLKIDRWKKGSVRDEAGSNVNALLRDLQTNIPPLLTAADAEPSALSRAIPLTKHLDAFYAVLLRVEEASRVSAPSEQISALQQTLLDVNKARIAYDDQLQTQAASQEKQVFDLRAELKTQKDASAALQAKTDAVGAPPAPCKPATPARKKKRTTAAQGTAPQGTTQSGKPGASTPAPPPKQ